jgi:toxin ParE1/3/4
MDYQVRLSRSARLDIEDIVRYISGDDPDRAATFGTFLVKHTERLGQFPELGRVVPELGDDSIREIIVRAYRVVYRIDHRKRLIEVIRFWPRGERHPIFPVERLLLR